MTTTERPNQHADDSIHGGTGSQAIVQITDSGVKWIVAMQAVTVLVIALACVAVGYSISLSIMQERAFDKQATEYRLHLATVMRLEAKVDAQQEHRQ